MDKPESIISSTIITRLFLISVLISLDIFIEPVEFIPSELEILIKSTSQSMPSFLIISAVKIKVSIQ